MSEPRHMGRAAPGRRCLGVLIALLLAIPLGGVAHAAVEDPTDRVRSILDDAADGGTVGLYLKQVGGPVVGAFNSTTQFEPASTIKALIHFHAMRQVQDGAQIDGQPVTLDREIPWFTDPDPSISSCPALTGQTTDTLATVLQAMMVPSDNRSTQGLRDFFGDAAIDATRQGFGMGATALAHLIGCGADAVANPNRLTLEDAGRMYEAVATGFLDDAIRDAAYNLMLRDGTRINNVINGEAAGLGLSLASRNAFGAQRDSALKAGSYGLSTGLYRSVAGWAELPFKDAQCQVAPRGYVFGAFIDAADNIVNDDIRTQGIELLREPIRAGLQSWVACEADLAHLGVTVVDPPTEIDVHTPVPLTVRHTVRNNGPAASMDATLSTLVTAPADCQLDPALTSTPLPALPIGQSVVVETPVQLTCSEPSHHTVFVDATITPTNADVVEPSPANNSAATNETIAVLASADLAVQGLDLQQLEDAGLGDLLVGQPFAFDADVQLHNFGDTVHGLYSAPVDGELSRTLVLPAGLSGAVEVHAVEAPATIVLEEDGQAPVVLANQVAGTVVTATGPGTLTVHSTVDDLEVGADRALVAPSVVHCDTPGLHEVGVAAGIRPVDPHVIDPEPANDAVEQTRTIECVTPVQINVRPGNPYNFVQPSSQQRVPVAVLTTVEGEYGLPTTFEASSVLGATTRFGTLETLESGGGSGAWPAAGQARDAHEPDDVTKDGDTDLVLLLAAAGTGVDATTTHACVVGSYVGAGGTSLTFLGCDAVHAPPGLA